MDIVSNFTILVQPQSALDELKQATVAKNYNVAPIFAGEAVGLVNQPRCAAAVVEGLGNEAERLLRAHLRTLLGD